MSKPILSNLDFQSVSKIINLPNAASAQEPVTLSQLNAAVEGLKSKDPAIVSTQGNINLSSPGATIDGITMVSGDRFLARLQTSQLENGIYIWNGAATPANRSLDYSIAAEVNNSLVPVLNGTDSGLTYRQTAANPVVGTNPIIFITFGNIVPSASTTAEGKIEIATQAEVNTGTDALRAVTPSTLANYTGLIKKFSVLIGDGSATQYDVTHSLGTTDVTIAVYLVSTGEEVLVDAKRFSTSVVRINFAVAPASNAYKVVVVG